MVKDEPYNGQGVVTRMTSIYANGDRIGTSTNGNIRFEHAEPITGRRTDVEPDPLGQEVGTIDPGPDSPGDVGQYPEPHEFGNGEDPANGCTLDGITIDCPTLARFMNMGALASKWDEVHPNGTIQPRQAPIIPYGLGLFKIWLPDNARGNDQQYSAYLVAYDFVTPPSDCEEFVDQLVDYTQGITGQTNSGRLMARWAGDTLAPQLLGRDYAPTGFQQKYIQGGQNWGVMVHVAGVAGGTLIGDNILDPRPWPFGGRKGPHGETTGSAMVAGQFEEDRNQRNTGLIRQAFGLKTTGGSKILADIEGYRPDYPLDKFIAEKNAELWDDGAGVSVGRTLEKVFAGQKSPKQARSEIFHLLCQRKPRRR